MRLLLIEDEPDLMDSLAQALREEGYAVDTAEDGLDGLDKALAPARRPCLKCQEKARARFHPKPRADGGALPGQPKFFMIS